MIADAWRLAVGTLTTWRVRPPSRVDAQVAGWAMALAPLAVLPVALGCALVAGLVTSSGFVPAGVAAAVVLAVLALSTRGMHLDGLADLADGLCAGFEPARSLEIMKRSDTGAGGVAAVVLVLLVQYAALTELLRMPLLGLGLVPCVLVSRHALAWACRRGVPAATERGLGATVASSVAWPLLALATASMLVGLTIAAVLGHTVFGGGLAWAGPQVWALAVAYVAPIWVAGVAGAFAVVHVARRRLGGITGDVLGAAVEIAFACALVIACVVTTGAINAVSPLL